MRLAQGGGDADPPPAPQVLQGRHVAVLVPGDDHPSALVFSSAAQALGAHVARIAMADLHLDDPVHAPDTARLLGRLYAAMGCAGLDKASLALLRHHCGVPVLHDLAAATHASRLLADVMTLKQALHAAGRLALPRPRLGIWGAPRSRLLQAWQKMAAGVAVEVVDLSQPGADARAAACDFVCRPGMPPELLVLDASRGVAAGGSSLAAQQRVNHRLVVQALLRNEVAAQR